MATSGQCCSVATGPVKSHAAFHRSDIGGMETTEKGGKASAVGAIAAFVGFLTPIRFCTPRARLSRLTVLSRLHDPLHS